MSDPRVDYKAILEDVKANFAKLDACPVHDFEPFEFIGDGKLVRKHRCKKCGGLLDSLMARWYQKGLAHSRRETATPPPERTPEQP